MGPFKKNDVGVHTVCVCFKVLKGCVFGGGGGIGGYKPHPQYKKLK